MKQYRNQMQDQFNKMQKTGQLFVSKISGAQVWKMYLKSFKDDPVFRDPESSQHNCNHCNNFIKRYGNIIAFDADLNIMTIWDFVPTDEEYLPVNKELSKLVSISGIRDVFFETFESLKSLPYEKFKRSQTAYRLGVQNNVKRYTSEEAKEYPGTVKADEIFKFEHLSLLVDNKFVKKLEGSIDKIKGKFREDKQVFERGLTIISTDTLNLVIDLIEQGSLLDGGAHKSKVENMLEFAKDFESVPKQNQDAWFWQKSYENFNAKFKNSLIGVLCTEIATGVELNKACENWNKRVDPINYKKAKAPITERQKEEAKIFVDKNGYTSAFSRRIATIDDIKTNEILHLNDEGGSVEKDIHLFDSVKPTKPTRHKKSEFNGIEEVSIENFMEHILPKCTSVEAFLTANHENNMVTLTTSKSEDSKQIFQWNNPFSWTFNGNIAGKSQLREAVSSKGGRVDGVFRFSHSWNELEPNQSLMDLHVFFPNHNGHKDGKHDNYGNDNRVGWNRRVNSITKGSQDVDYTSAAPPGYIPVENITFPDIKLMPEGVYTCKIHNWSFRTSGGRGKAEIEFDNQIYQYEYPATTHKEWITVAKVTLKDGKFDIRHILPEINTSKEVYNLDTQKFHKVKLACLSPNHWGENSVGNKHYFFFLEGAQSKTKIRSFHNENLKSDLVSHRKVMEVLADSTMVESDKSELSGLGFNSTVKDELIVRLQGSHKRVVKIKF